MHIPIEGWSVEGISALASSLGKPKIMDEITAHMCQNGVGRTDYARVLVEIEANKELKDVIKVEYTDKNKNVKGTKEVKVIDVEEVMAKTGNEGKAKEMTDDGFIGVQNRKKVVQNQRWNWQKKSNHEERNKTQFVQKGMEEGASSSNGNQNGKKSKELKMLRDTIVVDQFLNKKLQPSCSEVSKWSNDMVKYFKDRWEIDRLKEKEDQMQNMEDVFENDEGIAQTLTADTVKGLGKGSLN
ncbi:hypothetical protein Tco_0019957 [Tanacetum coccineum]